MWGVFGFAAASPRGDHAAGEAVPPAADAVTVPGVEKNAELIPLTGESQEASGARVVSVLLAFAALVAILALLNSANKPTVGSFRRKEPPEES
jgi:hypothetical protein